MKPSARFLALLSVLLLCPLVTDCTWEPKPPPDDPSVIIEPNSDAGPVEPSCATACATQLRLGCPGSEGSEGEDRVRGTADDLNCEQACEVLAKAGLPLDVACLTGAKTCGECDG